MALVFLLIAYGTGGRLQRRLAADPRRLAVLTASALIIAGVFAFLYWNVRLLVRREIIPWCPVAPWAG